MAYDSIFRRVFVTFQFTPECADTVGWKIALSVNGGLEMLYSIELDEPLTIAFADGSLYRMRAMELDDQGRLNKTHVIVGGANAIIDHPNVKVIDTRYEQTVGDSKNVATLKAA